jgi:UDP-N-acetylglucosamine--N-acetylmuramyl-(pentapeptide) pyrophosphoryl-undecaprenol N-acetylglucosamine transferase
VVSGGGSGGHIYPALAIAQAFPGEDVLFIGARGHMEERIVPAAGVPFLGLSVSGLNRKRTTEKLMGVARAGSALAEALLILRRRRPWAVVGTGGYVTGPVGLAASLLGIPLFLLEANVTPGLANRMLLRRASRIFLAYAGTEALLPRDVRPRAIVTGVPVRPEIAAADRGTARKELSLGREDVLVLVVGGSQGADALNRAAALIVEAKLPVRLLWATGERYFARWQRYRGPAVDVRPYIDDMATALAAADLAVARAGSSTLSELTVRGLPAVLVPSPHVPDDHQRKNALHLEREGAAVVVDEEDIDRHLVPAVARLLAPERRREMAAAAGRLGHRDALLRIVAQLREEALARTRS